MSIETFTTRKDKEIDQHIVDKRLEKNEMNLKNESMKTNNLDARLKSYKDDNGKEYRVEDNLVPNNKYEINGYKYQTDSQGRIESVEGKLHLKHHEGRKEIKDSIDIIGKGDQKETDDRGHVVGDQFDGSNGMENITVQDSKENKGSYKKLEDQLAKEVKDGKDVKININIKYDENSNRPTARVFHYSIDGERHMQIFPNGGLK